MDSRTTACDGDASGASLCTLGPPAKSMIGYNPIRAQRTLNMAGQPGKEETQWM
jgi:hypothetical protein